MMKRTKNLRKRGLALFLALVMCFGLLQTTAWAEDEVPPTDSNDVTVGDSGTTDTKDDVMDDPSGDDVDKDTPETNVTPDTDDSVPKTEAGGVDYEKDERENAGDTTPSDDPDHAGYPWAEDKEWPRTEDVVIDGEHDVTVPVKGETTEGDPSAIEGGTSETDTWTGEGDAHIKWEEHKKDDEGNEVLDGEGNPIVDKKVEVDVDVTVKGEETSTDTTTSDALGVHETTTVNGSETVKTEIDRTDTVENPDPVDKLDSQTDAIKQDNNYKDIANDTEPPADTKNQQNNTGVNVPVESVTATAVAGEKGNKGTGSATADVTGIVNKLKEEAEKNAVNKTTPIKDNDGNEIGEEVVETKVEEVTEGGAKGVKTTVTTTTTVTKPYNEVDSTKQIGLTDTEKNDAMEALLKEQYAAIEGLEGYKIEEKRDENGKLIGYDLIKTVEKHDEATAQDVITLPERPLESVTTAENGDETRVEVQDRLDANGNVIGYVKTTTVTSASGSVSTKTEVLSGTKTSSSKTTADSIHTIKTTVTGVTLNEDGTMVTTTTKVTETEVKTVTASERKVEVTLGGSSVTATGTGTAWESVGGTTGISSYKPDYYDTKSEYGYWDNTKKIYVAYNHSDGTNNYPFYVEGHTGSVGNAHIFQIGEKGKDNTFFAYCADWDINPHYGEPRKDGIEVEQSGYFDGATAQKIREIALNGFWGSASGLGSLDYVKSLDSEKFSGLTANAAMAATQAAIWKTGGSRGKDGLGQQQSLSDSTVQYENIQLLTGNEKIAAEAFYNYLTGLTGKPQGAVVDSKNEATSATVTVGNKNDNNTYQTDVSFTLKDVPSGNFKVYVNGQEYEVKSSDVKNNTITLKGLSLKAGNVKVEVGGFKCTEKEAYLYKTADSHTKGQTMIAIRQRTNDAKLTFNLTFGVVESEAKIDTTHTKNTQQQDDYAFVIDAVAKTEDKTETHIETETLRYWDARTVETNTYEYGDDDDDDDDDDVVTGDDDDDDDVVTGDDDDDDTTTVEEEPTPLAEAPEIQDEVTVPEENVPLAEAPEEEEEVEIPEEDVPLAEVPATGDISGAWYAMTILAGCGLAVLTLRKKEQDA